RNWRVTSLFGARQKIQPVSWGPTIFGDPGSRALDSRNFVDATYTHNFDSSHSLQWRTYYDSYRFRGIFRYQGDSVEDNRVFFTGDWVGSQVNYRFPLRRLGAFTVGASGRFDLRASQQNFDVNPTHETYVNIDKRDKAAALFAQDELDLSPKWKLN